MELIFSANLKLGMYEVWNDKPEFKYHECHQIHSNLICHINDIPCQADGIQVELHGLKSPVCIKTADCLPVVIEGKKGICFIHAGWKGLSLGILTQSIIKEIEPFQAFIGPSIHECCFEVSEDFKTNFKSSANFKERKQKFYFDLISEASSQLKSTYQIDVIDSNICTCCNLNFNSYRRNKTTVRNYNIFRKGI